MEMELSLCLGLWDNSVLMKAMEFVIISSGFGWVFFYYFDVWTEEQQQYFVNE